LPARSGCWPPSGNGSWPANTPTARSNTTSSAPRARKC
jgi:hypothetical protein